MTQDKFEKQRMWVNEKFGSMTSGKSYTNKQKTKILKKLWKQAKRKY